MRRIQIGGQIGISLVLPLLLWVPASGSEADLEHFEKSVRPLLVEQCYACHSSEAPSIFANLRLDSRGAILEGGDSGPAVVPGDAAASLLVQAVRGEAKVPMPPTGRLQDRQIAALEAWVAAGAPWPDEEAAGLPDASEEFDLDRRRQEHWAWQPVVPTNPPDVQDEDWARTDVDRFVLARLEEHGLQPAPPADRYTLLRRLSFALTGLPPARKQIEEFLADDSPRAVEIVVERLLSSPHFGERWARHWMDLVRYTESHGSEGDPDIPDAWRYRDYLIRAFNDDIPYDQLVREHLAGDLLPEPRINRELGLNESLLGTAHYRMIEHGFQPVDPWEDRVKWTDNQVDVFSKAFQGLTVSCARCHDHKFDAISQRDYYALFGVFSGARPVQRAVDTQDLLDRNLDGLVSTKAAIRNELASIWAEVAANLPVRMLRGDPTVSRALEAAACDPDSVLYPWFDLADRPEAGVQSGWDRIARGWDRQRSLRQGFNEERFQKIWNLSAGAHGWKRLGTGMVQGVSPAGEFSVLPAGERIVEGIYPSGVHSGLLSRRHNGVLQTPRFTIDSDYVSFLVQGSGLSVVRLIVENYAVPRGGIYWQRYSPKSDEPRWAGWDTTFWKGFSAYLEFATVQDATNFLLDSEDAAKNPKPKPSSDGRSHFGAVAVAFHDDDVYPKDLEPAIEFLLDGQSPDSRDSLARLYADRLLVAIGAWRDGSVSAAGAAYLDFFVRNRILPSSTGLSDRLDRLVAQYRALEDEVPVYRRVPSVLEEAGPDQPLLVRGNHNDRGEPVARRYLAALGSQPYDDPEMTRLRLAEEVTNPRNPLTSRVIVNRVWRHLFGRGLVATVDNFGRVGSPPSHPGLLNYLADQFVRNDWSVKQLIQSLVLTSTYQLASDASPLAAQLDPGNELLQHMPVRRLEGEVIRDALLTVSGRLDSRLLGPSINVYYAFAKGKTKGDREKGPVDGDGRRSIYQEVRRNAHNPFLEVFDQPKPSSTRGHRDVTNVPAQSLTMLNSPLVVAQAERWGEDLAIRKESASHTVRTMFLDALGRPPGPLELDRSLGYLGKGPSSEAWSDLAHALFNLKEFIYVR